MTDFSTTSPRYTRVAIWLHWLIALAIIGNLFGGFFHDAFGAAKGQVMAVHKATGILILVLSVIRVLWRLTHRAPPLPASTPAWQRSVSGVTHFALYAMMLAMPLSGWAMASASDRPLTFYGLFDLPRLAVAKGSALAGAAHEAHEIGGIIMALLVVMHIAAALQHHFVLRDGLLARMGMGRSDASA